MTRISFIMPTFNRSALIAESLQAILAQADDTDEILVVDDGSTDATSAVVHSLGPRVRYVRQDNAGKSAALNRALAMTDGDYVWICDDDDLLRAGAVPRLVAALQSSGADFVFGRHERFRADSAGNRVAMGPGYWPDLATGTLARHVLEDAFVMQNGALVRRASYARVGAFDESFLRSQDYEMFVRLALECSGAYVDTVVFDQRKHDGVRGPSTVRHAATGADEVWQQYDRMIFQANAARVSRRAFETMFDGADADHVRRAALLQRACVHARHGLWPVVVADLADAAAILPERPLHSVERTICRRMFGGKHGFSGAMEGATRTELGRMYNGSAAHARIIRAGLAGLLWRLRRDTPMVRRAALSLLTTIAGPRGTVGVVAEHLRGRNDRAIDDSLWEKGLMRIAA
ncbi:glycosyltransferase family 2 protein [Polymorphobacter fuscus]|nr:glycosyltransferase family 2 protein [Polymorphobacter fuscus]NJC08776.1 hypothetical protein [Polymorphobacter fuscus]